MDKVKAVKPGKTSVWLTPELAETINATGAGVPELLRRGAAAPAPHEDLIRRAVAVAVAAERDELLAAVRGVVRSEVKAALAQAREGAFVD